MFMRLREAVAVAMPRSFTNGGRSPVELCECVHCSSAQFRPRAPAVKRVRAAGERRALLGFRSVYSTDGRRDTGSRRAGKAPVQSHQDQGGHPMLVLTRKIGERILVGDQIVFTILDVRGSQVR